MRHHRLEDLLRDARRKLKDLALLVGAEQKWLSTEAFLDKVSANVQKALG